MQNVVKDIGKLDMPELRRTAMRAIVQNHGRAPHPTLNRKSMREMTEEELRDLIAWYEEKK